MKTTLEEISPIKKKLLIEVPYDAYLKEEQKAYQKLNQKVVLKGFRRGKAPRQLLEKYYKDQVDHDVISEVLEHSYTHALQEYKLDPVASPKISDLKREVGQPIQYTAEVEIRPTVNATDYKNIPLKQKSTEPTEAEIQKEFDALRELNAQITPLESDSPIQIGQIGIIDFVGRIDQQVFEGGSGEGTWVELGKKHFLEDFENGIVGMKKGDTKTVEVQFPDAYPKLSLAGKKALFEITLNEIKEKKLAELNDEFAKDLGKETLAEITQEVKNRIEQNKKNQNRAGLFNQIIDYLIQKHAFEIPEAMTERELKAMLENTERQLEQQSMTLADAGMTAEKFFDENRATATRRVKAFFLIESIGRNEKIEVTQADMKQKIEKIAQSVQQSAAAVEQYYRANHLLPLIHTQVLEERVLDYLLSQTDVETAE